MSGNSPQMQAALAMALAQRVNQSPPLDIFANQIRMAVTLTDFTLVFGAAGSEQVLGIGGGTGAAAVVDKAAVHVAPGMLKQIMLQIEMAIEAYESVMGPIKIPNRLTADVTKHRRALAAMLRQQMEQESPEEAPNEVP